MNREERNDLEIFISRWENGGGNITDGEMQNTMATLCKLLLENTYNTCVECGEPRLWLDSGMCLKCYNDK